MTNRELVKRSEDEQELEPLEIWAKIKKDLSDLSELVLSRHGYTWKTFRELEKTAIEQTKGLGSEVISTQSGQVQIVKKKRYLSQVRGSEVETKTTLHFINPER